MSFAVPKVQPTTCEINVKVKREVFIVIGLFMLTTCTAVSLHNFLHLPPMMGMMTGLASLKLFGFYLKKTHKNGGPGSSGWDPNKAEEQIGDTVAFDVVYRNIARAEWDT